LAGETEVLGENLPSAALSTTNPICCPDENRGRRGGKPKTNLLCYSTANHYFTRFSNLFYYLNAVNRLTNELMKETYSSLKTVVLLSFIPPYGGLFWTTEPLLHEFSLAKH
jgi:hypothetical protein